MEDIQGESRIQSETPRQTRNKRSEQEDEGEKGWRKTNRNEHQAQRMEKKGGTDAKLKPQTPQQALHVTDQQRARNPEPTSTVKLMLYHFEYFLSLNAKLQYLTCCTPPWFHGPSKSRQCCPARAENAAQAVPLVTHAQPAMPKFKPDRHWKIVTIEFSINI